MRADERTSDASAATECELCHGTGWREDEHGAVSRCECFVRARQARLLQTARLPHRYRHCALGNFDTDFSGAHASLEGARLKVERYVERFPDLKHGLLFSGPVGVGKTHLAVATLRELIVRHRVRGLFADYRDLLREIQESYNPVAETSELQVLRPLLDADVLLLDELGARRPTAWVRDTVTHLINDRYNRELPTLITTNYPDEAAADRACLTERIGERLRSRLYEMCDRVVMDGSDFRKGLKSAAYR